MYKVLTKFITLTANHKSFHMCVCPREKDEFIYCPCKKLTLLSESVSSLYVGVGISKLMSYLSIHVCVLTQKPLAVLHYVRTPKPEYIC